MKVQSLTRRNFIQRGLAALSVVAAWPVVAVFSACQKKETGYPGGLFPVDESGNATARALNYHRDHSKVDGVRFPTYASLDGVAKTCANCSFFQPTQDTIWGRCTLIQGGLVAAQGWCTSWVKRG